MPLEASSSLARAAAFGVTETSVPCSISVVIVTSVSFRYVHRTLRVEGRPPTALCGRNRRTVGSRHDAIAASEIPRQGGWVDWGHGSPDERLEERAVVLAGAGRDADAFETGAWAASAEQ